MILLLLFRETILRIVVSLHRKRSSCWHHHHSSETMPSRPVLHDQGCVGTTKTTSIDQTGVETLDRTRLLWYIVEIASWRWLIEMECSGNDMLLHCQQSNEHLWMCAMVLLLLLLLVVGITSSK